MAGEAHMVRDGPEEGDAEEGGHGRQDGLVHVDGGHQLLHLGLGVHILWLLEVHADGQALVQVDPAGLLQLEILEGDFVGGDVEDVEEEDGLHRDAPENPPPSWFRSLLLL